MIRFYISLLLVALFVGCSSSDSRYSTDVADAGGDKTGAADGVGTGIGVGDESSNGDAAGGANPGQVVDKDLELVTHLVARVLKPKLQSFVVETKILNLAVRNSCNSGSIDVRQLQASWKKTMMDFHYLNTLAIGPLGDDSGVLAEKIYSPGFQKVSVVIDNEIKKAFNKGANYKLKKNKKHLVGLDSFEYVLFSYLEGSSAPEESCNYLTAVSSYLMDTVFALKSKWETQYLVELNSPNGQTQLKDVYIKEAVDRMVVFADKIIKDKKLGAPLGLKVGDSYDCIQGDTCHQVYLEHPYSQLGKEAMDIHLMALEDIFTTTQDSIFGFSDYINSMPPLEDIQLAWQLVPEGEEYAESFKKYYNISSTGMTEDQTNATYQAYVDLKVLTDWLKVDFVAELNTELPGSVQGDND